MSGKMMFPCVAVLGVLTLTAAADPRFSINGQPITGSFAYTWEADDLRQALDTGVNLFYCYDRRAGAQLLDPTTEMGALIKEHHAKVMANICSLVSSGPLKGDVDASATEIELDKPMAFAEPRVLWIGDEAVLVERAEKGRLLGCTRGHYGTPPKPHPKGEYLMNDELARQEVLRVKDSPNLWGYWIVDDKKGNQRGGLRALYRIIKELDRDVNGKPNDHVAVAGMADPEALTNFDGDMCDMIGVYIYPGRAGAFRTDLTAKRLVEMLPTLRERMPGMPIMGIFQAFTGTKWTPKPTPLQMRKQVMDFSHFGASAFMAYSWRMVKDHDTLRNMPDLREEYGKIIRDLRAGAIPLDQPWPNYPTPPTGRPELRALTPLLTFDQSSPDFKKGQRVSAEYAPGPDDKQWLHCHFGQYTSGGQQWPGVRLDAPPLNAEAPWFGAGWLVVRVHNYLPSDSEMGISIRDTRPDTWWADYFPLPNSRTTDVAIPMEEVRRGIDLTRIASMTILMRRPPVDTHFAVQGFYLALLTFVDTDATYRAVSLPQGPAVDGSASDPCWSRAELVPLRDAVLDLEPLRPCLMRIVAAEKRLAFLLQSKVAFQPLMSTPVGQEGPWQITDDTVEVLVASEDQGVFIRCLLNPSGKAAVGAYDAKGRELPMPPIEHSSTAEEDQWTLEMAIETAAIGRGPWGLRVGRRDTQLGDLVWPKSPTTPVGFIAIGRLEMAP